MGFAIASLIATIAGTASMVWAFDDRDEARGLFFGLLGMATMLGGVCGLIGSAIHAIRSLL